MTAELKYINFEHIGLVIFEPTVEHRQMQLIVGRKALSAGFCSFPNEDEVGNQPRCYGKSTSLNLDSSPKDTPALKRLLNPYGW